MSTALNKFGYGSLKHKPFSTISDQRRSNVGWFYVELYRL